MTIRTRFAPSPTGYLHIGGVRTALFNWLFARRHGGKFILRIDDTDQQRNLKEALQPILDGFRWLGIDWDEGPEAGGDLGPYYQSQRLDRYRNAARKLVENGSAYWDYATKDELDAERKTAEAEKLPYNYSRKWLAESDADRQRFEAEGRQGVVRLKMPREGFCEFKDHIRGDMKVAWATEQDHVIQRADGTCLYNLANVVDDFDMRISHVIRAEEHLSNTPRQVFIARGLGYPPPEYAHIPFVAEPGSKNKLSKRKIPQYLKNPDFKKVYEHGKAVADRIGLACTAESFNPVLVEFYQQVGYLPHAVINYLLLLGWSLDDKAEFFTKDEMFKVFSLERVNKSAASFDAKKLLAFQEHYMQAVPVEQKLEMALPYLEKAKLVPSPAPAEAKEKARQIVASASERIKVAGDVLDYSDFFQPDDQLSYDQPAFDKQIRKPPEAAPLLRKLQDRLTAAPGGDTVAAMDALVTGFVAAEGIQLKQIQSALRVALTGKAVGFGLFETLAVLGKARSVRRIERALGRL